MNENFKMRCSNKAFINIPDYNTWENLNVSKGTCNKNEGLREGLIIFILNGCLSIKVGQLEEQIISKGYFISVPHGSKYCMKAIEDSHLICCHFNVDVLLPFCRPIKEFTILLQEVKYEFNPLKTNDLLSSFLELINKYTKTDFLEFINKYTKTDERGLVFFEMKKKELFYILFTCYTKHEIVNFLYPILNDDMKFKEFIHNNYMETSNLSELAELAHYSLSGFVKKFHRHFGEAPYSWIMRNKAERILIDLETDTLTLQEIAHKYKFASYRSFSRFCQTQFGVSPSKITARNS